MRTLLLSALATAVLALPAAAQTLDRIKETGTLKLGFRTDAAPLSYLDDEGNPAGYSPLVCAGLAQAITNQLEMTNLSAEFVAVDSADRFDKVVSGDIDLLCGAATITLKRREIVDFSVPTYIDGTAVMLPKDANPDLEALAGMRLGVRANTTTEETLANSLRAAGLDAEVFSFSSHDAGIAAMENTEIDAYFADQSILLFLFLDSEKSEQFKISDEILTIEKHGLAMARGDADFRLLVDTALTELFSNGTMDEIFDISLPGATPGIGMQAVRLLSPTQP